MHTTILTGTHRAAVVIACVLAGGLIPTPASADSDREFRLRDDCEPVSFNAAIGPGACIGNGGTTFDEFNNELARRHTVGSWKFNPDDTDLDRDERIIVVNRGGETHTFTQVAAFGGGFVAGLNEASDNPVPAPECATMQPDGTLVPRPASPTNLFVAAHARTPGPTLRVGTTFFQCCIHPWMRSRVVQER